MEEAHWFSNVRARFKFPEPHPQTVHQGRVQEFAFLMRNGASTAGLGPHFENKMPKLEESSIEGGTSRWQLTN